MVSHYFVIIEAELTLHGTNDLCCVSDGVYQGIDRDQHTLRGLRRFRKKKVEYSRSIDLRFVTSSRIIQKRCE